MSQRDSGYERIERDAYETPEWVTQALVPHLPLESHPMNIWEPACGSGKMVRALERMGHKVRGTDINDPVSKDFFVTERYDVCDAIITNPPYAIADKFIDRALLMMRPDGTVAMLLRTDYDHAKSRKYLFADCPAFMKKLVLTKRIKWFDDSTGQPSFNHAWFIWNWGNRNRPVLAYH